jgi:predicted acyltransferase (DUF342 family)
LFLLGLYFGFREWRYPEDDTPLAIDVEYVRVENYFGWSFRNKMREWVRAARPVFVKRSPPIRAVLERDNGERIAMMQEGELGAGSEQAELVWCNRNLTLAEGSVFRREIYCRGKVNGGSRVRLQALASDDEVTLGPETDVARWVDAARRVRLGRGSVVHSRVSSGETIELEAGVQAQSLFAPLIFTAGYHGEQDNTPAGEAVRKEQGRGPENLQNAVEMAADTLLVAGDLELKAGSSVEKNLVIRGTLRSGANCHFWGDVKAAKVRLGPNNTVWRNLVSSGTLEVGEKGRLALAAIADQDVLLGAGTRVGQPGALGVVVASGNVKLHRDVAVCGKISAGHAVYAL